MLIEVFREIACANKHLIDEDKELVGIRDHLMNLTYALPVRAELEYQGWGFRRETVFYVCPIEVRQDGSITIGQERREPLRLCVFRPQLKLADLLAETNQRESVFNIWTRLAFESPW